MMEREGMPLPWSHPPISTVVFLVLNIYKQMFEDARFKVELTVHLGRIWECGHGAINRYNRYKVIKVSNKVD